MKRFLRAPLLAFLVGLATAGAGVGGAIVRTSFLEDPVETVNEVVGSQEAPAAPVAGAPEAGAAAAGSSAAGATAQVAGVGQDPELTPQEIPPAAAMQVSVPTGGRLPAGTFLVGASRASLFPTPELFGGETWQREGCTTYGVGGSFNPNADHLLPNVDPADPVGTVQQIPGWPAASPDCIYLGGFGIGPVRPAERVGFGGVWVRTVAISNGERTFIYGIADTVGWFARYDARVCSDCGIRDVRRRVSTDLGIGMGDVIFGSTHTHAGADTYGGWGGIPGWYRSQIRDAAVASAKQAVATMRPATISVGESHLRDRNNERRDTYYSTADTGASWLQARGNPGAVKGPVIATWATYAAHPTIVGGPLLHADWPGAGARRFESRYGGVGMVFEGGLGNVSISGAGSGSEEERAEATGTAFADSVSADIQRNPIRLGSNDMGSAVQDITHPALTNPGLITLATVGLFDREFLPNTEGAGLPGAYWWSKAGELSTSGEQNDPQPNPVFLRGCPTAGPTVRTTVGAHRIGEFVVAFTPGEIFSTIAEVIKERADRSAVTMVLGQTNDALGYIIQSFEYDTLGLGAVGEYATMHGEYEEVFAIDRCFGDHVLESALESTGALNAGG